MYRVANGECALMPLGVMCGTGGLIAGRRRQGSPTGLRQAGDSHASASVSDGLPDQLGDIDDQIGSGLTWIAGWADLAGADADRVVQPAIRLAVGQVKH